MLPDKKRTFGENMESIERNTKKNSAIGRNKAGRKMYATIIVVSSGHVDYLSEEIIKHSIPDEMKIWSDEGMHYAMLFYHTWKEPE